MTAITHEEAREVMRLSFGEDPACEWIHECEDEPVFRVWFAACQRIPGCGGHLLCRVHARGGQTGLVRIEPLP